MHFNDFEDLSGKDGVSFSLVSFIFVRLKSQTLEHSGDADRVLLALPRRCFDSLGEWFSNVARREQERFVDVAFCAVSDYRRAEHFLAALDDLGALLRVAADEIDCEHAAFAQPFFPHF